MPTRLIIVGGFLGAGKTTLLLNAAHKLLARGYRVGLITNDQGEDLVDTVLGQQASIPVTEVAGAVFAVAFPIYWRGCNGCARWLILKLSWQIVGSCTERIWADFYHNSVKIRLNQPNSLNPRSSAVEFV